MSALRKPLPGLTRKLRLHDSLGQALYLLQQPRGILPCMGDELCISSPKHLCDGGIVFPAISYVVPSPLL